MLEPEGHLLEQVANIPCSWQFEDLPRESAFSLLELVLDGLPAPHLAVDHPLRLARADRLAVLLEQPPGAGLALALQDYYQGRSYILAQKVELHRGLREPVEHVPPHPAVHPRQPLIQQPQHHHIRHSLPFGHLPQGDSLSTLGDIVGDDLRGGYEGHPVLAGHRLAQRRAAGPRWPENQH